MPTPVFSSCFLAYKFVSRQEMFFLIGTLYFTNARKIILLISIAFNCFVLINEMTASEKGFTIMLSHPLYFSNKVFKLQTILLYRCHQAAWKASSSTATYLVTWRINGPSKKYILTKTWINWLWVRPCTAWSSAIFFNTFQTGGVSSLRQKKKKSEMLTRTKNQASYASRNHKQKGATILWLTACLTEFASPSH